MNEPVDNPLSDEYVNAFLDGELAADERERALKRLEEDDDFKGRVCELRGLKERVKGAYAELPAVAVRRGRGRLSDAWRQALAAGVLLALGLAGGWVARDQSIQAPVHERIAGLPDGYRPVALADKVDPDKIVLHLDSREPARVAAVLDLAEKILERRGARSQVEIVVNSFGVDLVRQDTTSQRERIDRLLARHTNLGFTACGQTVARLGSEGVKVQLLPGVHVGSAAISEILNRMQEGWVYVKV